MGTAPRVMIVHPPPFPLQLLPPPLPSPHSPLPFLPPLRQFKPFLLHPGCVTVAVPRRRRAAAVVCCWGEGVGIGGVKVAGAAGAAGAVVDYGGVEEGADECESGGGGG